jgi:uncharacterized protein YbaR (Trm112 family)
MLLTCDYLNNEYCTGCYHSGDHLAEWTCILRECTHAPALFIEMNVNCTLCTHQAECKQYKASKIIDLLTDPEECKAYKDIQGIEMRCISAAPEHDELVCRDDKDMKEGKLHCKDCNRVYNDVKDTWDVKHKKRFHSNFEKNFKIKKKRKKLFGIL